MSRKILLIDDNEEYRESLKNFISSMFPDSEVEEASSTDEGLKKARDGKYEFILTDKDLKDKYGNRGGIYLSKTLRQEKYSGKIILHSAALTDEDKKELKEVGVDSCKN